MTITKDTWKMLRRLFISVLIIGVVIAGIYLLMRLLGIHDLTQEELREYIGSFGVWAPIVFVVASFLQVTFIPIPSTVTILAGNYVFGPWVSFLCSYIGCVLGSIVAFALGRLIGRPFVNWVAGSGEKVDGWLKKLKGREKILLFFMFLLPFFPDDLLCSVAGILPISWFGFILIQLLTRITSIACTITFMSGEIIPYEGWGLVVIIVGCLLCIVAFILSLKYSVEINAWFDNFVNRRFRRRGVKIKKKKGVTNVLVVRHGESMANSAEIFLGQGNMDLTERGHEQAERTAQFLANIEIDKIYSSDLTRAYQTARHIADKKGLSVETSKNLREIDAGEWDYKPWGELPNLYPEEYGLWIRSIGEAKCTGGESFSDTRVRLIGEMSRIAESHKGETIVVCAHAVCILSFLSEVLGTSPEKVKELSYPSNASVSHFVYKDGKFSLVEYSHDEYMRDIATKLPEGV